MSTAATLAPEIQALILAALGKRVAEQERLVRATFGTLYAPGQTQKFRSPLDEAPLGLVQRTSPDPQWKVTDGTALREHLAGFPGCVETLYELDVPGVRDPVALPENHPLTQVLLFHAPELLNPVQRVTEDAVQSAVDQSTATGKAAAPGITLVRPGGQMRVVPAKEAGAAIERLVAAGWLTWDGTPALAPVEDVA